jgi:hypothetical protein
MRPLVEFLKTTFVGGLLFLIPVVLVVLLLEKALHIAATGLAPVAHHLPMQGVMGIALAQVAAACALLLVCFLAGLVIRARAGASVNARLEQLILRRMPGFTFVKTIARRAGGVGSGVRTVGGARADRRSVGTRLRGRASQRPLHRVRAECSDSGGRFDLLPDGRPLEGARRFGVGRGGVHHAARHRFARAARQPASACRRTRPTWRP